MKKLIVLMMVFVGMNSFYTNPSFENCSDDEIEAMIISDFEALEKATTDAKSLASLQAFKKILLKKENRSSGCFTHCYNEFVECANTTSLPISQCMVAFRECRRACPF